MKHVSAYKHFTGSSSENLFFSSSNDLTTNIEKLIQRLNKFYWTDSKCCLWTYDFKEKSILFAPASTDTCLFVELKPSKVRYLGVSKDASNYFNCFPKQWEQENDDSLDLQSLHQISLLISPAILTGSITISKSSSVFGRLLNEEITVHSSGKVNYVSGLSPHEGLKKNISFDRDNGYSKYWTTPQYSLES